MPLYCHVCRPALLLQDVPADDPKHGQDVTADRHPVTAAGQANSASLGQAAGGQAEPSASAANGEKKAEWAKRDRHTGKSDGGGGGAAAAEAGKGKAKANPEKSKTHRAAKAQLVISVLLSVLLD